jgi:hypothetical protein
MRVLRFYALNSNVLLRVKTVHNISPDKAFTGRLRL